MAEKQPTNEELQAQIKELQERQAKQDRNERLFRENSFGLGGQVISLNLVEGKQRFKKENGVDVPVLDKDGQLTFWDDSYYLKVAYTGGEESFKLDVEKSQGIKEGMRVYVDGRIGTYGLQAVSVTILD